MSNVLYLHCGERTELIFLGILANVSSKVTLANKNVDFINVVHSTNTTFSVAVDNVNHAPHSFRNWQII